MAEKITGIIMLGLVAIGYLVWMGWRADRQAKIEDEQRKQRFEELKQHDDYLMSVFEKILARQDAAIEALQKERDEERAKNERMLTNARKLKIKDIELLKGDEQ